MDLKNCKTDMHFIHLHPTLYRKAWQSTKSSCASVRVCKEMAQARAVPTGTWVVAGCKETTERFFQSFMNAKSHQFAAFHGDKRSRLKLSCSKVELKSSVDLPRPNTMRSRNGFRKPQIGFPGNNRVDNQSFNKECIEVKELFDDVLTAIKLLQSQRNIHEQEQQQVGQRHSRRNTPSSQEKLKEIITAERFNHKTLTAVSFTASDLPLLQTKLFETFKTSSQNLSVDQSILGCLRSMAISLLSFTCCIHLGCMDVQAQTQVERPFLNSPAFTQSDFSFPSSVADSMKMDSKIVALATPSASFQSFEETEVFKGGEIFRVAEGGSMCEETYGVLPCSESVGGNVFLMLAYGYLLFIAANLISDGSELLLEVMNPGLLGGLVLPILGAFPDSILILVSGTGGSAQQAQEEVMVGVGVLAGSSVMLLTVAWAGSLLAGRCDLTASNGTAQDLTLTHRFDLLGTGVTTDEQTRVGAWIMMASTLPFVLAQLPLLPGHLADGPQAALSGGVVASLGLFAYCAYQVASPWLQNKKIEEARLQFFRFRALQRITSFRAPALRPTLLLQMEAGQGPSLELVKNLFDSFDKNGDGKIQQDELRGLIIGIGLEEAGYVPAENQVEIWLQEFDLDIDGTISEHEFVTGIAKWVKRVTEENLFQQTHNASSLVAKDPDFWAAKSNDAKAVLELLESEAGLTVEEMEEEREESKELGPSQIYRRAAVLMIAGAAIAAVFADPMVDSIGNFSGASGIPPFFVAFVVTPFASNASELVSSIIFAKRKRKRNISLTFSQVYGAITMNNTLCMAIFLALVYVRGLTWDFSSEVTVILVCTFAFGVLTGTRSTFPAWFALPVLALYPLAIAGVAVLDNVLGWH